MGGLCSNISVQSASSKNDQQTSNSISSKYLQLSHFQYIATLGEGSFGKVILVRRKSTQDLFAIKFIQTDRLQDLVKREYARFERQVLLEIQNPFIVKLHHIFESSGKLCFVLDFMQGGSLGFHLNKSGKFEKNEVVFFAAEVLVALELLHKREFIYRDLKPENILVDINGHLKLADFNLSTSVEDFSDSICGTPEYAAPEIISGDIQGIEIDFWGFGVLLYHMIQGSTPFKAINNYDVCKNILAGKYSFTGNFDKVSIDLISRLLVKNPKDRLCSHWKIKQHQFFSGVDWTAVEKRDLSSPLSLNLENPCDLKYFPKKKYPKISMENGHSTDLNGSGSQFSDFSYNSEI